MKINLLWNGPYRYRNARDMTGRTDYGIYQIYGSHPVNGLETLLYIGQANDQTFGERMRNDDRNFLAGGDGWEDNGTRYRIHLGRIHLLTGAARPSDELWGKWIDLAEALLIYAHSPAWNRNHVFNVPGTKKYGSVHVLNWGQYGKLLPEVSGARFTNRVYDRLRDNPLRYRR